MNELFPVLCGALIGFACSRIGNVRRRTAYWILLSLHGGVAATVISGEFKLGWQYLLVDIPLAAFAGLGIMTLLRRFRYERQASARAT